MHLSSNLKRLILYTVQSSTSRIEILQLVQSVLGWNILILYCLTNRHPVLKFPSDSSILFTTVLDRDVLFRFTLVLTAFSFGAVLAVTIRIPSPYSPVILANCFHHLNSIDDKYNSDKLFSQQSNCERARSENYPLFLNK